MQRVCRTHAAVTGLPSPSRSAHNSLLASFVSLPQRVIKHNNNTGRWVVPFRPVWSPAGDAVLTGDMKRGVALFDAASGAQKCLLASDYLTAIPSRLALHPAGLPVMAAATSSGRVHIWR